MLQNMLGDLSETDLSETLEGLCRQHAHDPRAMRQAIRQVGDQWTEQLRELSQLGTQILGHLSELQQVTGAMRQRPAASLLNPMVAFVATLARSNGFDASLTTVGGEEEIDVTMLTTLRNAVQGYLQQRMSQPVHAPRRLHMTIRRQNEVVALTLDEDGKSIPTRELLAEVESHLQPHSGSAKLIQTPEGRHRLHLFLPVSMVVVEGMVVSAHQTRYIIPVGAIRTILQPDPSALLRVSAGGSENLWLRLNANEIIPVRDVSKARSATIGAAKTLSASQIFVVVSVAQSCVALPVDELLGQQLILSRPLRGVMAGLSGLSGVALLSRGDVAMVISPDSLCRPQALAG
jgi:two-component system chemotaxis sensor kinase CheA